MGGEDGRDAFFAHPWFRFVHVILSPSSFRLPFRRTSRRILRREGKRTGTREEWRIRPETSGTERIEGARRKRRAREGASSSFRVTNPLTIRSFDRRRLPSLPLVPSFVFDRLHRFPFCSPPFLRVLGSLLREPSLQRVLSVRVYPISHEWRNVPLPWGMGRRPPRSGSVFSHTRVGLGIGLGNRHRMLEQARTRASRDTLPKDHRQGLHRRPSRFVHFGKTASVPTLGVPNLPRKGTVRASPPCIQER